MEPMVDEEVDMLDLAYGLTETYVSSLHFGHAMDMYNTGLLELVSEISHCDCSLKWVISLIVR